MSEREAWEDEDVEPDDEEMITIEEVNARVDARVAAAQQGTAPPAVTGRTPPHAMDAERALLGGILLDPTAWHDVADVDLVPSDFYRPAHGLVWQAIADLSNRGEPADTLMVVDELLKRGQLDQVGGAAAISQLEGLLPTSAHCQQYAGIVKEKAALRAMIKRAEQLVAACYAQTAPADELIEQGQRAFVDMAVQKKHAVADRAATVRKVMSAIGKPQTQGLPTGWADLDNGVLRRGLRRGNLIYVGARPGMGKSVFGQQLAAYVADKHASTAFFSLEMNEEELIERELAGAAGLGASTWAASLAGRDSSRLQKAAGFVSERQMHLVYCPGWRIGQIAAEARRLVARAGVSLVVVDYLGLIGGSGIYAGERTQEVGEVSRALKALAGQLNIPIVCLVQLNRGVEARADKRPMLSDLRDSGEIEQDADVVAFLYRAEYYLKENTPDDLKNIAEVIIAKQRNGPCDTCKLWFEGETTRFLSVQPENR